jgi:uncharacterized protein YjiS (DUF1127 family)
MPIQQKDFTSEPDAARLDVGLSIALLKDADGALPERDAAGPTVASTPSVPSLLKPYWRAFWEWRRRRSFPATVHDLSDRELMDIGLTRAEIDCIARHPALDRLRDSAVYLWIGPGL